MLKQINIEKVYQRVDHGIAQLHVFSPKSATYIRGLKTVISRDMPYAAINVRGSLYINPEGMMPLTDQQFLGVLLHELMHLTLKHFDYQEMGFDGKEEIDQRLLNIACDFIINDQLVKVFNEMATMNICFSKGFGYPEGLSVKEYYDLLKNERDEKLREQLEKLLELIGSGKGVDELLDEIEGKLGSSNSMGDIPQDIKDQLDDLGEWLDENLKDSQKYGIGNSSATTGESVFVDDGFVETHYVTRILRQVLGSITTSKSGQSRSYKRISRRQYSEVLQKGKVNERKRVLVALDVSGSMDEKKLNLSTAFISRIATQMHLDVWYLTYNTRIIQEPKKFNKEDRIKIGGGTQAKVVQEYYENDPRFQMLFIVSDAQDYYILPHKPTFGFFMDGENNHRIMDCLGKHEVAPFDYIWIDGTGVDSVRS